MGVAGLWDILRPAAKTRSLTDLSVTEGFIANPNGLRGFRLGIDASIWFFHAEYGKEGENPVLRTLFFRCATLMHSPFLPLFVFDGPKRPDVKRGKKINRTPHKLIPGMKQIVESFGFEWRMAPAEAEAELAYLNRIGLLDGILSDDVDNFLFGATCVIRNPSNNLSGNRMNPNLNAAGKDDKNHTQVYRLSDIQQHDKISLTRGGMILIGLLSGGDYQQSGLSRCGTLTAHGLAKCGFGDSLYTAAKNLSRERLPDFLINWRHELRHELRTNSQNKIGRKHPSLAKSIPEDFPDIDILLSYVNPITSETMGRESNNLKLTWDKEPDLAKLAGTCEMYFEWGYKEAIIKRFRTVIWHSIVLRILRRAVLNLDKKISTPEAPFTTPSKAKFPPGEASGTPSKMIAKHFSTFSLGQLKGCLSDDSDIEEDPDERLMIKVHSSRTHASTDGILEYRVEIAPFQLVRIAESGLKGLRSAEGPDEWASEDEEGETKFKGPKTAPPTPDSHMRIWMPACMMEMVEPRLVREFQQKTEAKLAKKAAVKPVKAAPKAGVKAKPHRKPKSIHSIEDDDSLAHPNPGQKSTLLVSTSSVRLDIESDGDLFDDDNNMHLLTENLKPSTSALPSLETRTFIRDLTKNRLGACGNTGLKSFFPTAKRPTNTTTNLKPKLVGPKPKRVMNNSSRLYVEVSDEDSSQSKTTRPTSPQQKQYSSVGPSTLLNSSSFKQTNSLTSTKDPRKAESSSILGVKKLIQPAPFPLSFEDDITPSDESDTHRDHIRKSPRKSASHSSPRSYHANRISPRPTSPSPSHPKLKKPLYLVMSLQPGQIPVIEISDSESDDMPARTPSEVYSMPNLPCNYKTIPRKMVQADIIDLT